MEQSGYYEIGMNARHRPQTKAFALVGNVIYNRLHWHDHLEVMCCLKGKFSMRVDGDIYTLKEGDFLTVNCNCAHEIFEGTKDGLQIIFSVDASLLKKKEEEQYEFSTVGKGALRPDCEDAACFRENVAHLALLMTPEKDRLRSYFEKGSGEKEDQVIFAREEDWYRFYICLYRCLVCMAGHKRGEAKGNKDRRPKEQLQRCIRLIHQEYAKTLDAGVLARKTGLSQPTIYRMFQKHLGISLNDYIRLVRVYAACAMMEQTSDEIAQIAFACGFSSISNFYRVFRQRTGQTPREYRCGRQYEKKDGQLQREFLDLNRFQNFYELPYTKEDIKKFGERKSSF